MFARQANPSVDRPIVRKSLSYLKQQVSDLLADWVDPQNPTKGIIAREILPRGEPTFLPDLMVCLGLPPAEVSGLRFDDPERDSAKLEERGRLVRQARMVTYFGTDKELRAIVQ